MIHIVSYAEGFKKPTAKDGLKIWRKSIHEHFPIAKLTLLSPDGIEGSVPCEKPLKKNPICYRWTPFTEFLSTLPDDEFVLLCDCRDVVFNGNPTEALMEWLVPEEPIFMSEFQISEKHQWCQRQALTLQRYTQFRYDMKQNEVNGGVIAGLAKTLTLFSAQIRFATQLLSNTRISDQPIINGWARTFPCQVIDDPAIYCHGEVVKLGRWKETIEPRESLIYHQYDRVEGDNDFYREKYL